MVWISPVAHQIDSEQKCLLLKSNRLCLHLAYWIFFLFFISSSFQQSSCWSCLLLTFLKVPGSLFIHFLVISCVFLASVYGLRINFQLVCLNLKDALLINYLTLFLAWKILIRSLDQLDQNLTVIIFIFLNCYTFLLIFVTYKIHDFLRSKNAFFWILINFNLFNFSISFLNIINENS